MMEQESIISICPPPKDEYEGDATFSCAADGYWMLCTVFIVLLWIGSLVMTARRVGQTRADSANPGLDPQSIVPVLRSSRPDV